MSNVEYQAETYRIELRRPNSGTPWGFRLQGGVDFSTPLSVQVVNPGSISEQCGLMSGDAILSINGRNTDELTHDAAKQEIVRAGCDIDFLIQRGAVKIWKPAVTPLSELRPQELNTIKSATGEDFNPVQKTSLAYNSPQEPCNIGSSHNRSAQPFGGASNAAPKQAVPNVVHAQFNTPIGLYSADNLATSYKNQTAGIQKEMGNLDLNYSDVGDRTSGFGQQLPEQQSQGSVIRSVNAPVAKPPGQQPQRQPLMKCGACGDTVKGVAVKAAGQPYCMKCFVCASCGVNLKQKGYFVVDGKLYCEIHAKQKTRPPGPGMTAVASYR